MRASRALLPIRFSVPSVLPPSPLWTAFSPFASYTPIVTSTQPKIWTTRALLTWMGDAFTKKGLDSPRLMGEMLMSHVLKCDRLKLYMDADRPASADERESLRVLVGRALKHEPVQYLVGEAWFFGLPLRVTPEVLIPRPCTETIIEQVLGHCRAEPGFGGKTGEGVRFADLCTGSGCIAIALAKNLPQATGIATDISEAALAVAKANAEKHKVAERLEFVHGDLSRRSLSIPRAAATTCTTSAPIRRISPTASGTTPMAWG